MILIPRFTIKVIRITLILEVRLSLSTPRSITTTSANRKPALAARSLSASYLGRSKGAESALNARRELRALDLSLILAR